MLLGQIECLDRIPQPFACDSAPYLLERAVCLVDLVHDSFEVGLHGGLGVARSRDIRFRDTFFRFRQGAVSIRCLAKLRFSTLEILRLALLPKRLEPAAFGGVPFQNRCSGSFGELQLCTCSFDGCPGAADRAGRAPGPGCFAALRAQHGIRPDLSLPEKRRFGRSASRTRSRSSSASTLASAHPVPHAKRSAPSARSYSSTQKASTPTTRNSG